MRQMMIMAAIVVSMAVAGARMADQAGRTTAAVPAAAAVVAPQESSGGSVVVPRDVRGHFVVDARINGRHMQFLIDTGATVVALKARDAAMLGIHPVARDFTVPVSTANGSTRAAPTQLNMVEVANLNVRNVTALVSPDEALSENLLGMSFLSRLKRAEISNGRMVLEQ